MTKLVHWVDSLLKWFLAVISVHLASRMSTFLIDVMPKLGVWRPLCLCNSLAFDEVLGCFNPCTYSPSVIGSVKLNSILWS